MWQRVLAPGADRQSHVERETTARNEQDDHVRGGNEDCVGDHLISKEAWQDGCSTYNGTVDKIGALGRDKTTNYAQSHRRWRFGAADIRYREQEMAQQGEEALVTQQQGRGTVDKRTLIRREIVTRTYRILDPFDLLTSTSSKLRLRLYEMMDKDTELLSKPVPKESTTEVIDEAKDVDHTGRLKNDPADDAVGRNLREQAKGAGLEEVTPSVPQGGYRRLGKLNRRVESSFYIVLLKLFCLILSTNSLFIAWGRHFIDYELVCVAFVTEAEREGAQEGRPIWSTIVKDLIVIVYISLRVPWSLKFCLYGATWVKQYIFPPSITAPEAQIISDSRNHIVRKFLSHKNCKSKSSSPRSVRDKYGK